MSGSWHSPGTGRSETEANRGMERDGLRSRVCMHADGTIASADGGQVRMTCDYCPATAVLTPGAPVPEIPPWYWGEPVRSPMSR